MFTLRKIFIVEIIVLIVNSYQRFQMNVLSYHQYQCSIFSTKESENEQKEKQLTVMIKCKSHFKAKDIDINLDYILDNSLEKSEDSFLNHLFYVNERGSKICIECLLLEEEKKKNYEIIEEDDKTIKLERTKVYPITPEEAQILKIVRVNVMEQQTFKRESWNDHLLINKQTMLKILSQIIFAYFIVLYEF